MNATAKEYVPNRLDNKKVNNYSKEIKENKEKNWIAPKHVPIDYFCIKYRNAEEKKERRKNRHELLKCKDDNERHGEGKESETAINESVEVDKIKNKKGNSTKKREKRETNNMEMHEEELKKRKKLERKLRKGN